MGNNLDLCEMLGLPKKIICPNCTKEINPRFDDYDVECGNPNPESGRWKLMCFCDYCEHEWSEQYEIEANHL